MCALSRVEILTIASARDDERDNVLGLPVMSAHCISFGFKMLDSACHARGGTRCALAGDARVRDAEQAKRARVESRACSRDRVWCGALVSLCKKSLNKVPAPHRSPHGTKEVRAVFFAPMTTATGEAILPIDHGTTCRIPHSLQLLRFLPPPPACGLPMLALSLMAYSLDSSMQQVQQRLRDCKVNRKVVMQHVRCQPWRSAARCRPRTASGSARRWHDVPRVQAQ